MSRPAIQYWLQIEHHLTIDVSDYTGIIMTVEESWHYLNKEDWFL